MRVFRTCRELGIATVAVAAPDDAGALHARSADETVAIASYLDSERAHPRREARPAPTRSIPATGSWPRAPSSPPAVEAAGLDLGRAAGRRRCARAATSSSRSGSRARRACRRSTTATRSELGFPLLVKAAAGGGGRGMRIVRSAGELDDALDAAAPRGAGGVRRRHRLLRALPRAARGTSRSSCSPTRTGRCSSLGERECSIQRRHQKVLEESPSPALDDELRGELERRGGPVRDGDRLPRRRHGRVPRRGPRVLLPRAERPHPGRASGHRGRHRPRPRRRPDPDRRGPTRSTPTGRADGPRDRGSALRRGSADVPAAGGPDRAAPPSGRRPRRRRASRRATRSGRATTR